MNEERFLDRHDSHEGGAKQQWTHDTTAAEIPPVPASAGGKTWATELTGTPMGGTDSQGTRLPGHGRVLLAAARASAGIVPTPLAKMMLERRVMYGSDLDPDGRKGNGSGLDKGEEWADSAS